MSFWNRPARARRDYSRKRFGGNPLYAPAQVRKNRLRTIIRALACVAALSGWLWFLGWSEILRVTEIRITGNDAIPEWEIRDAVEEVLGGRTLGIVPKRGILFVREGEIRAKLEERFVFERLEIRKAPPHTLKIDLVERISNVLMQMPDGAQYTLDLAGAVVRAYAPEEAIDTTVRLGPEPGESAAQPRKAVPVLMNERDESFALREHAAKQEVVAAAIELPSLFEEAFGRKIFLTKMSVDGSDSGTMRIQTSEGWSAYLDALQPLAPQLANANAVIASKVGDRRRLEYVDVRFGEKIFFKLKE